MSLSRTGARSDEPAPPAEPRRRFGFRRGPQRALPAATAPAAVPAPVAEPVRAALPATVPAPAPAPAAGSASAPGSSVLRAVGPHFVIAPSTAREGDLTAAIGALRPVPDAVVVVAAAPDSAKILRDRMADLGVIARARGAAHLVLAASGLAALAPNGRRPAEVVAERAGVPVVAPDGLVEITPGGNLKVTDPAGAVEASSWWRCEPGQAPRRLNDTIGAAASVTAPVPAPVTSPAPAPRPGSPSAGAPVVGGRADAVRVLRLPAGFWLTDPADPSTAPLPDLRLAAAPPGNAVVIIGTPARPVLLPEDFAEAVLSLPLGTDRPLVSAPWAAPDQLAALTGALAARTARPVQAAIGLPVLGPGGPTSRVLDRDGRAGWEPFLLRLATSPGAPATPAAWRNGGADWRTDGPAVFRAFPYWALEAVPAGLWLRPEPPHVLTPRFRRPEAARPLLIVGERDRPVPADAFEELGTLLDRLPAAGAEGFGLLVHGLLEPTAERVGRFVARMHELEWLGAEQPLNGPPAVAPVSYGIGRPTAAPRPATAAPSAPRSAALGRAARAEARAELPAAQRVPEVPVVPAASEVPATGTAPTARHQVPPVPEPGPLPVPPPTPVRATAAPATGSSAGAAVPSRRAPLAAEESPAPTPALGGTTVAGGDPAGPPTRTATSGAALPFRTPEVPPLPAVPSVPPVPPVEPPAEPDHEAPPPTAAPTAPAPGPEPASEPTNEPAEASAPSPRPPSPGPTAARHFGLDDSPAPVTATSPAERDAVRTLLGDHYHRCTGRLEQLATRLPGLRSTSQDDFKPDLAAVLLHHTDTGVPTTRAALVAAARSGDPALQPFLRCLGAGLRRLPSHHGAVLLGAAAGPDPDAVLAHYPTGRHFREPAPLSGLTAPGAELPGSSVEFLVWSATGRRTSVFDSADGPAQAVFPPGTAFTVVGVVPSDGDRPACVLLRESGGDPSERNRNALTRLRAWLERRAAMPPAERPRADSPDRFHLTPGVALDPPGPGGTPGHP
ncbi:hypothetical protein ACFVUH_14855 [Kitasatospora sp. NPDC058032]|uniref:hypothetical protein n=1 Tax=Kitasatospora sp. NPDC058032 TaxID=3346307 RepID=UPI0036DF7ADC